jgi:hypothetical protein
VVVQRFCNSNATVLACPAVLRENITRSLDDLPDCDAEPALAHDALITIANSIMDMAVAENRRLSEWEKSNVAGAISALAIGWLHLAWTDLDLAVADPKTVSPDPVSKEHAAALAEIDESQMRRALAYLAGLRPWTWNRA